MFVSHLSLKNFRNYKNLTVEFNPEVNLITGKNAQGKTNLVEAVYMISMGKSFRTQRDRDLVRFGSDLARIESRVQKEVIDTEVEIAITSASKKAIKKDGSSLGRTSELMKNVIIIVFSPEDLRLVKDEPEKRRRFIDRELSQISPAYFNAISNYRKVLLQRNKYLKENNSADEFLDVLDDQLSDYAARVMLKRNAFIKKIGKAGCVIHNSITDDTETLEISYDSNVVLMNMIEEQRDVFREVLLKNRQSDLYTGNTGRGPHKDDMSFKINGVDVRKFGSQGQQRTCALSLKLAELDLIRSETGERGILILDDVMSELDYIRRRYLVRTLKGHQLFITSTDVDDEFTDGYNNVSIWKVENGAIIDTGKD